MTEADVQWTIDYAGEKFEKFFLSLPEYEQAVLTAAITHVLQVRGMHVCSGEWGKALGEGLYEFRVRRSLQAILTEAGAQLPGNLQGADRQVLLRVFCTFHGSKIVLLLSGYDKRRDPSTKRQGREIKAARKILKAWKKAS